MVIAMLLEEHLVAVPDDAKKLILLVAETAKTVRRGFLDHTHFSGTKNIYDEEQLALDKWADEVFTQAFEKSMLVRNVASEEQGEINQIVKSQGSWGVTMDPLDGSSCVATNLSVGTIVGMFNEGDVMEQGNRMDAACYVLYGPLTTFVYAYKGKGCHEFVLDEKKNKFVLRQESIKIPEGKIYGTGALRKDFIPQHEKAIAALEKEGYKVRFSGSFTADVNQVLHYGGLFTYPASKKDANGKLRLLFEANPVAFLIKEAGGSSFSGKQGILDITPHTLSQRTPVYVGDRKTIALVKGFF